MVKFNSSTKQRVLRSRERLARDSALMPWGLALVGGLAVLSIVMVFTSTGLTLRGQLGMALPALFLVGLFVAGVAMLRVNKRNQDVPLLDVAIAVRGDSVWFSEERSLSGVLKRPAETWPLLSTSVAIGTQMGWLPSLVFTAPGYKPRWFYLSALDQPAEEVLGQIEVRKAALPR